MRKDFMVDYKYYCADNRRSFRRERRAFIVYKNKLDFMPENCDMLHYTDENDEIMQRYWIELE